MAKKDDKKRYKCMNYGACAKADSGEIIEIDAIETLSGKPLCPYCHQDTLEELPDKGLDTKKIMYIAGGTAIAAALGVGGYFLTAGGDEPETPGEGPVVKVQHSVDISNVEAEKGWNVTPIDFAKAKKNDTIWVASAGELSEEAAAKGTALTITLVDSTSTATPASVTLTDVATVKVTSEDGKLTREYTFALKKAEQPKGPDTVKKSDGKKGGGDKGDGGDKTPPKLSPYGTVNLGYGVYTGDLKDGKPHGHGTIKYKKSHKIVSSQEYVANPGDEFEGNFRNGIPSGGLGYWKHNGDVTGIKL